MSAARRPGTAQENWQVPAERVTVIVEVSPLVTVERTAMLCGIT
jgi:hypothetical protein